MGMIATHVRPRRISACTTTHSPGQRRLTVEWCRTERLLEDDFRRLQGSNILSAAMAYEFNVGLLPAANSNGRMNLQDVDRDDCTWVSVMWKPSTDLPESLVALIWPQLTLAYFQRPGAATAAMDLPYILPSQRGLDLKAPRRSHFAGDDNAHIALITEETNPDRDIMPPGDTPVLTAEEIAVVGGDESSREVSWFKANGQYVGTTDRRRAGLLLAMHRAVNSEATDKERLQAGIALLTRHKLRYDPRVEHLEAEQAHRWTAPRDLVPHLARACSTQMEWFASPLDRCPDIPNFASEHRSDEAFGALHEAYGHKWTGSGDFHPPHTEAARAALRWAIMSTSEARPVLNFGILVHDKEDCLAHLTSCDQVHALMHLSPRQAASAGLQFQRPEYYQNQRNAYNLPRNKHISLVIVANSAGLRGYCDHTALVAPPPALRHILGRPGDFWRGPAAPAHSTTKTTFSTSRATAMQPIHPKSQTPLRRLLRWPPWMMPHWMRCSYPASWLIRCCDTQTKTATGTRMAAKTRRERSKAPWSIRIRVARSI